MKCFLLLPKLSLPKVLYSNKPIKKKNIYIYYFFFIFFFFPGTLLLYSYFAVDSHAWHYIAIAILNGFQHFAFLFKVDRCFLIKYSH